MGISTTTAARIFDGQQRNESGEENVLSWEAFPYTALSKTYNTDAQVPDSAGTATAFASGVKTRKGTYSDILLASGELGAASSGSMNPCSAMFKEQCSRTKEVVANIATK
jgi:hypothetical protein